MKRFLYGAAAALALLGPASALSTADANKAVESFIAAPGFAAFDVEQIHDPASKYEAMFPKPENPGALHADAEISPLEKALLLVDAYEAQQPDRMRYQVSYGHVVEDADGEQQVVYLVEVRRYNLGPLIHKETQKEYGPENTADAEAFGIGPDVAWRFAFATVQGNNALALSGSRAVIGEGAVQLDETAESAACLSGPCRSIAARAVEFVPAGAGPAEPLTPEATQTPYFVSASDGDLPISRAAYVARSLQSLLGLSAGGVWTMPETPEAGAPGEPFLVIQVDQNLGQEIVSEGVGGLTRLNDDSISAIYASAVFWSSDPPSEAQRRTVKR